MIAILKACEKDEVVLLAHKDATWAIDFYRKNSFDIISGKEDIIEEYAESVINTIYLPNTLLMSKYLLNPEKVEVRQ